jgi:hypothetical protein
LYIFLDTTLTFSDPFFMGKNSKRMLEIVEKNNGIIFICDLVLKETRKNYIANIEINLRKLKNQYKQLNKYLLTPFNPNDFYTPEKYIEEFDQFYTELVNNSYIEVLEYNNEFLPEVIRRSIESIKPFAENRKEFMDCLIWLTYSSFVEEEELEDCYLISNNISDYYDETNRNLHPDLLNDTKRIKPYRFPSDLIRYEPLLAKNDEMLSWAENEKIDESYLKSLFQSDLFELTNSFFQEFFSKLMPIDIYKYSIGKLIEPGMEIEFVELLNLNVLGTNNIEIKVFDGDLLIFGELDLSVNLNLLHHNPLIKVGDPFTIKLGESKERVRAEFSFLFNKEKVVSECEFYGVIVNP